MGDDHWYWEGDTKQANYRARRANHFAHVRDGDKFTLINKIVSLINLFIF